ncbi:hypothetical protein K438DRAFT_1707299 [Mycena galopus ATCC 62051]|nr:hypothetical protein K438DRAFT_1707299 [Mycena galopus ATCC 62051]
MRRTVIDYVACSRSSWDKIVGFKVCNRVKGYDHAATVLDIKLNFDAQSSLFSSPSKKRKVEIALPDATHLDKLFISTLQAGKDNEKKVLSLYGAVTSMTPALKVAVHGTCLNAGKISAAASAAAYWGPDACLNTSARLTGQQTSPRAELLAVILALQKAPSFKTIEIHTRSEYAIRSAVYYAARNDACGWRNTNGDLSKIIVSLIKARTAPVHFCHIKKDDAADNGHLRGAKEAATLACSLPPSNKSPSIPHVQNNPNPSSTSTCINVPKVSADIPDDRLPEGNPPPKAIPKRLAMPEGHRGRDRLASLKDSNRKKVLEAETSGIFWKEIRRLADPKPAPISVTASSLKDTFEKRLNPQEILPPQFDAAQHKINKILSDLLPENTEDTTPEGFFSRKWDERDMGRLKDHLRKHSLASSSGEDQTTYADLLEIPNEDLAPLYNDYRLIALESCFLKGLTILTHWVIFDWAESRHLIPQFQKGFRPGYRTNNNPFILRCLKEWARANQSAHWTAHGRSGITNPLESIPLGFVDAS